MRHEIVQCSIALEPTEWSLAVLSSIKNIVVLCTASPVDSCLPLAMHPVLVCIFQFYNVAVPKSW